MTKFFKWFTISAIIVAFALFILKVQTMHYTGGTGNASYTPSSSATGQRPYGIFRLDDSKPDPKKVHCQSPTTANDGQWEATVDGNLQTFDSLQELNDELGEKYGLEFRPLTLFESITRWFNSLF